MTNRPVIQIPVDDTAFKRFVEAYKQFEERIAEMPESWKHLDEAMHGVGKTQEGLKEGAGEYNESLAELAGHMDGAAQKQALLHKLAVSSAESWAIGATSTALIVEAIEKASKAQANLGKETEKTAKHTVGIARAAEQATTYLARARSMLTSLVGFTGLAGGLGAIGGGIGMFDLAGVATRQTVTGMGLGLSPGQLAAYRVNLAPFIGESPLYGAANAQTDITKGGLLATLGVPFGTAQGESASELVIDEMRAIRRAWQANPILNSPQAQAALQLGFSAQNVRTIGTMSEEDFRRYTGGATHDARGLGFSPEVARDWIMLDVALKRAETSIESSLIQGLAPLTPQIAELARDISDLLAAGLRSGNFKELMTDLGDGIKWIAKEISSPHFKDDLRELGNDIMYVARRIVEGARYIDSWIPKSPATLQAERNDKDKQALLQGGPQHAGGADTRNWMERAQDWAVLHMRSLTHEYDRGRLQQFAEAAEQAYPSVPKGLLFQLAGIESGFGKSLISPAGAVGPWQFMHGTADMLHIDPLDPKQAAMGAGHYLQILHDQFGSWRKAIAAWNWGPGKLKADIAAHGDAWEAFAPAETQGMIQKLAPFFPNEGGVAAPNGIPPGPAPKAAGKPIWGPRVTQEDLPAPGGGGSASSGNPQLDQIIKRLEALHATVAQQGPARVSVTNSTGARVDVQTNAARGSG